MHKKKIQALAVAGVLTVGVVGGTLAWFTSQDSVKNTFNTGASNDENGKGIKIVEEFKSPEAMLPGDEVNKDVQVSNTTTYDQFIRVKKITPKFVDVNNNRTVITEKDGKQLYTNKIKLKFTDKLNTDKKEGTWFEGSDGYYYYMGKVAQKKWTNTLLDSVTLVNDAENEYRGLGFDVDIEADSIQASHDAYKEWAENSGLLERFAELQNKEAIAPTDSLIIPTTQNK